MSTCRSCDKPIKWIKTKSGKNMPCDPDRINYSEANQGDILVTETGATMIVDHKLGYYGVKGYISHFATCPDANKWRKGRNENNI